MSLPSDVIERARAIPIETVVDARAMGLRRQGRELVGGCPRCGGRDRFQVHPAKGLFFCRQCNPRGGNVIALTMHLHGIGFTAAIELLTGARPAPDLRKPAQRQAPAMKEEPTDAERLAYAHTIWRAAVPIAGTAGETYLRDRGIDLAEVPGDGGLRFHDTCPYRGGPAPCVIGQYASVIAGVPRGIHRRSIVPGADPKTMALGPVGGAVVRLWSDEDLTMGLVIGEGIETVLAAASRVEYRGTLLRPAWACGSAGTLENFPLLLGVRSLTILADHDATGRGQEAAARCAERWADAGREVTILMPRDFGDMADVIARAAA